MARLDIQTGAVGAHQLTMMDCPNCGEVFAVSFEYDQARRRDGRGFHCPNGHTASYSIGETAEQREKKELRRRAEQAEAQAASERRMREFAETRFRGANIIAGKAKAATRRLRARIESGVCPNCKRTFKQLAAHMKCKHGVR